MQGVSLAYSINEDINAADDYFISFNIDLPFATAASLEGDGQVNQYLSFRPKDTFADWTTVVCTTGFNNTGAFTGKKGTFLYEVNNYRGTVEGSKATLDPTTAVNEAKIFLASKMNSQRDSADNVFFNAVPKSDAPTPYTKSQLDPTT